MINEVLPSNVSVLADEDGDFSDWIEIFNPGSSELVLNGYKISDRSDSDRAWEFPEVSIASEDYMVLWASGKNKTGTEVHLDFKLSQGEVIYLFDTDDILIDSLIIGAVCSDVSFGLVNNDLRYFTLATPGTVNSQTSFLGLLENEIIFSNDGGSVSQFTLELSTSNDATIRYTLDSTEPTQNSSEYAGPISINSTTVVRARLFKDEFLPSKSTSRTYLLNTQHTLPIITLVTEPDNFFDVENGIYAYGTDYVNQLPFFGANFWEDWERPLHLSFYNNNQLELEINGGTRIYGGWSRANDQRSLSFFARGQYGPSQINYKLFPGQDYDRFQSFVLRNSGNDFLRSNMRDITLTSIMKGSGLEFPDYRSVATYLNGEYWGMYNMREKINEHFLASKQDVNPVDITLLEFYGASIIGDSTSYLNLINYVESNSLVSNLNFSVVDEQIDVENYIIYNVAQIYFDNTDWPGNNVKFWKTENTKWRWILYDTDFGFGIWSPFGYLNNTLAFALEDSGPVWPNPPWSTLLFRKCAENQGFRHQFINRFADELNSRFLPMRVTQHISNIQAILSSEIVNHYQRWGGNQNSWNNELEGLRLFANNRPARVKDFIVSEFSLPDYHELRLEISNNAHGYVYINNRLKITQSTWTGDYFETVPIELIALPRPGFVFSHWENDLSSTESKIILDVNSDKTLRAVFEEVDPSIHSIVINEINYNSADDFDSKDWVELHNRSDNYLDLSGWVIKDSQDDQEFVFHDGFLLAGDDYIVVSRNLSAFQTVHPEVINAIGGLSFGFSSEMDDVRLYNSANTLIDSVTYSSTDPWDLLANGEGYTLELKMPDLDNSIPQNWSHIHVNGSPGVTNLVISSVENVIDGLDFKLFPNPINKELHITLQLEKPQEILLELLSANGVVLREIYSGLISTGRISLKENLGAFPAGLYLIRVKNKQGVSQLHKLIKQ